MTRQGLELGAEFAKEKKGNLHANTLPFPLQQEGGVSLRKKKKKKGRGVDVWPNQHEVNPEKRGSTCGIPVCTRGGKGGKNHRPLPQWVHKGGKGDASTFCMKRGGEKNPHPFPW